LLDAFASFDQFRQLGVHSAQLISGRRNRQPDRPSRSTAPLARSRRPPPGPRVQPGPSPGCSPFGDDGGCVHE
jgi:hypothetical protein